MIFIILLSSSASPLSVAGEAPLAEKKEPSTAFEFKVDRSRSRTFLLPPLVSFVLPGFDQWWEGQYTYAFAYSGAALGGLKLSSAAADGSFGLFPDGPRLGRLGQQLYQASGSMSAYHSFRTAVKSRQSSGDFSFLKHEESPVDLLVAPFHFSYLSRPTTYIGLPAHLLVAVLLSKIQGLDPFGSNWKVPGASDVFFSGAFSYNAGVGEEALFRGWLMPVSMHYMGNEIASNATTSLIFGALHFKSGYIPISQTLAGFYFGYLTQKNEWQLGEAIFNHTWFDVVVFLMSYAAADSVTRSQAVFQLSPISIPF